MNLRRIVDDEADELKAELDKVVLKKENAYVEDSDKAAELVSQLIRNEKTDRLAVRDIEYKINGLINSYSAASAAEHMSFYKQLKALSDRLSEQQKIKNLKNKTVIGLGGQFSAGKSKFINSVSGINSILPEAQSPTTAIPTYIVKSKTDRIIANTVYGYSCELTEEAMKALTHKFYEEYGIGFSAFVESIIVESSSYKLNDRIALLDTPGYTKPDNERTRLRAIVSDKRKAQEQLKTVDYLIWLVDIDNGVLQEGDRRFIQSLGKDIPVLIVFNKVDKKTFDDIKIILEKAKEDLKSYPFNCYGITAYSSQDNEEWNAAFIQNFFDFAAKSNKHSTDLTESLVKIEKDMKEKADIKKKETDRSAVLLKNGIADSKRVFEILSLAKVWKIQNDLSYKLYVFLKNFDSKVQKLNSQIEMYIRGGKRK